MAYWTTPDGVLYSTLYADMATQPHLLIAGATGSGKSVVVNGILHTLLATHSPATLDLILIDPKRVELVQYRHLPHTTYYASELDEFEKALKKALDITEARYRIMQKDGVKKWQYGDTYVVIDELADLMTTCRKTVQPLLQRLCQIGRAARVHVIAATQCPLAKILPTEIKVNFDARVGLRTRSGQDSRNILGVTGCETLPRYGQGFYMTPEGCDRYKLPLIAEEDIDALIEYWTDKRKCYVA